MDLGFYFERERERLDQRTKIQTSLPKRQQTKEPNRKVNRFVANSWTGKINNNNNESHFKSFKHI